MDKYRDEHQMDHAPKTVEVRQFLERAVRTNQSMIEHCDEIIDRLKRVLQGETVVGLKIGDPGITRRWCEKSLALYQASRERFAAELAAAKLALDAGVDLGTARATLSVAAAVEVGAGGAS
jgi:hypothetical protein